MKQISVTMALNNPIPDEYMIPIAVVVIFVIFFVYNNMQTTSRVGRRGRLGY